MLAQLDDSTLNKQPPIDERNFNNGNQQVASSELFDVSSEDLWHYFNNDNNDDVHLDHTYIVNDQTNMDDNDDIIKHTEKDTNKIQLRFSLQKIDNTTRNLPPRNETNKLYTKLKKEIS